jgi:hypothetical protein
LAVPIKSSKTLPILLKDRFLEIQEKGKKDVETGSFLAKLSLITAIFFYIFAFTLSFKTFFPIALMSLLSLGIVLKGRNQKHLAEKGLQNLTAIENNHEIGFKLFAEILKDFRGYHHVLFGDAAKCFLNNAQHVRVKLPVLVFFELKSVIYPEDWLLVRLLTG